MGMNHQQETQHKEPLSARALLFAGGATLLCALLAGYGGLLFLASLALATAMQAVLFRSSRFALNLLFTIPALALAYFITGSFIMLLPVASIPLAGYALARATARGENRAAMAADLTWIFAAAAVVMAAAALLLQMNAAGETDVLSYLDRTVMGALDGLAHEWAALYHSMADLYKSMGIEVVVLSEEVIREALLLLASVLPGLLLCLCYLLGLSATYLLQVVDLLCPSRSLFVKENRLYRPGALLAAAYLIAMPVAFFSGDFRNAFCLVCMNIAVFALPLFAFGALLQAPRLITFMRRMAIGWIDFAFFTVLLCLFILSNALYVLPVLALAYAIYILKSTLSPRKTEKK
jgi:hypothetical protein